MRKISIIDKVARLGATLILPVLLLSMLVACEDINSKHQKYLDQGENIYTGAVFELKAVAGFKRATFEWNINADPRIARTVIYWGAGRENSLEVPVIRTTSGTMQFSYEMTDMAEGDYTFEFITEDNAGHHSMPQQVSISIYGDGYKSNLLARDIKSLAWRANGDALVTLYGIYSNTTQYSTIEYTDNDGELLSVKIENNQTQTTLSNLKPLSELNISTTYLIKGGLDPVASAPKKYEVSAFEAELNKSMFAVVKDIPGDDYTTAGNNRYLDKIWDNSFDGASGILHTIQTTDGSKSLPFFFTFDMGMLANLSRFTIWGRTDATSQYYLSHNLRNFEIWATDELKGDTNDTDYWTTDAWKADWKMIGDYSPEKPATSAEQTTAWLAGFSYPVSQDLGFVRYMRIVVKSNWGGTICVNIAEMTIWFNGY